MLILNILFDIIYSLKLNQIMTSVIIFILFMVPKYIFSFFNINIKTIIDIFLILPTFTLQEMLIHTLQYTLVIIFLNIFKKRILKNIKLIDIFWV